MSRKIKYRVYYPEIKGETKEVDVYYASYDWKKNTTTTTKKKRETRVIEAVPARMEEIDMGEQYTDTTQFFRAQRDGIVMMWTGLFDVDGVEIYEDDIVISYSKKTGVENVLDGREIICFGRIDIGDNEGYQSNETVGFYRKRIRDDVVRHLDIHWHNLKVVGNIHQNPELIE